MLSQPQETSIERVDDLVSAVFDTLSGEDANASEVLSVAFTIAARACRVVLDGSLRPEDREHNRSLIEAASLQLLDVAKPARVN